MGARGPSSTPPTVAARDRENGGARSVGGTRTALGGRREGCRVLLTRSRRAIPAAGQSGLLTQLGIGSSDSIIATLVDTVLSAVRATVITPRGLLSIGSSVLTSLAGGPKVISRAQ